MEMRQSPRTWLLLGDILAVMVVSLIGFLSHYGELPGWRFFTTALPALVGWFLIAPWLGVYRPEHSANWRSVWRVGLAALLSAPLAGWLRAVWLGTAVAPVFVLVLGLTNALGLIVWRLLWPWITRWGNRNG
jgi:hypothetical protein